MCVCVCVDQCKVVKEAKSRQQIINYFVIEHKRRKWTWSSQAQNAPLKYIYEQENSENKMEWMNTDHSIPKSNMEKMLIFPTICEIECFYMIWFCFKTILSFDSPNNQEINFRIRKNLIKKSFNLVGMEWSMNEVRPRSMHRVSHLWAEKKETDCVTAYFYIFEALAMCF